MRRLRGDASVVEDYVRALDTLAKQRGVEALPDHSRSPTKMRTIDSHRTRSRPLRRPGRRRGGEEGPGPVTGRAGGALWSLLLHPRGPAPRRPRPHRPRIKRGGPPEVVAQVLRERLASVAPLRPLEEPMVEDDYPEERGAISAF